MQWLLKVLSGMANSVDPDQSSLIWVYTVCICHLSDHLVFEILRHLSYNTEIDIENHMGSLKNWGKFRFFFFFLFISDKNYLIYI